MAFGVSFEPFLSREVAISDSTFSSFSFNEEDIIRSLIHECVHSNQNKEIFDTKII